MSGRSGIDFVDAEGEPSSEVGFDDLDARVAGITIGPSSVTSSVSAASDDGFRYRMDRRRRGRFIIINNKTFKPNTGMGERKGTDIDAANLYADFKKLGFEVTTHNNQTASQMLKLMIEAAGQNYSDCDAFGVAVLTHGDNSELYGVDNVISMDRFIEPIKTCSTLAGKPKIFIIQACRGQKLDEGVDVKDAERDDEPVKPTYRIPIEADFLYAYSTVPGYFAWRNSTNGSWFVQALHKAMQKKMFEMEFVRLLTLVNHEVAYEFESKAGDAAWSGKKQVPSIVSTLTMDLYFTDKRR